MITQGAHLDDATLERLALGEFDADARAEALGHVAACAHCSRLWIALRAVAVGARAVDDDAPVIASGLEGRSGDDDDLVDAPPLAPPTPVVADELAARRRRNASWLIAGGAVAVAAAVLLVVVPARRSREPTDGPVRGDGHAAIAARVEATGGAPRLTWTPIAGVDGYRITVYRGDGRVAWGPIDAAAPPLDLPSAASLPPGRYRWRVEAVDDGRATARSPLLELVVER